MDLNLKRNLILGDIAHSSLTHLPSLVADFDGVAGCWEEVRTSDFDSIYHYITIAMNK